MDTQLEQKMKFPSRNSQQIVRNKLGKGSRLEINVYKSSKGNIIK